MYAIRDSKVAIVGEWFLMREWAELTMTWNPIPCGNNQLNSGVFLTRDIGFLQTPRPLYTRSTRHYSHLNQIRGFHASFSFQGDADAAPDVSKSTTKCLFCYKDLPVSEFTKHLTDKHDIHQVSLLGWISRHRNLQLCLGNYCPYIHS